MEYVRQFRYISKNGSGRASSFRAIFSGKEHFHRNEKWREPKWHHRSKYVGNYYKEKDTRRNNGSPK